MASSSSNVVGVHYRVGKKIGEGSFGVIFEGTNLLNNQQVAIKFVSIPPTQKTFRSRMPTIKPIANS
jgi:casein kinase 1